MVIDASVAFKLIFNEAGSSQLIELAAQTEFLAPNLLYTEIANAIWKRILRGDIPRDSGAEMQLEALAKVVRRIDELPMIPRALQLAVELGHPVYDCIYLAVAEELDEDLVTADRRFVRAVQGTPHAARVKELQT
jgi:predicted nucleic acid-binding protein